jgi:GT2 family glycosyltransferase
VVVVNNGDPIDVAGGRVIEAGGNLGFGAACNLGACESGADVLVFLNPDTVARPGAVTELARTLEDPAVGIAQARLRLLDEPELLNSSGNVVHVTGLAWPGGYRERAESLTEVRDVGYASGAACAIRADTFREVGGFTEELFLYQEDLELSWRVRLRGLRVVVAPGADVLHAYELERPGRRKEYFLERNRLVFVLTAYSTRLLVLLAPVLLAAEAGIALMAWRQGWLREKAAGWSWLVRNAGWIAKRRRATQALRRVPDRVAARHLSARLDARMLELPPGIVLANGLVAAWWRAVRVFL